MGAESSEELLFVGEEEFVAVGAAYDGGFFSKNLGFENILGVFFHPVENEFFRVSEEELESLADEWKSEATRRQVLRSGYIFAIP